ncbi:MAG TPA: type 2 isopentenyl-diphosphate Delta-isomerase [Firmicutes bacterium]|jgi:isopentenyl-diphosphate delta-isomerase|nr:type 2 isopentenyl-diphosphate Delta-isomerase [Bacillota bacterium]
MTRQARKLEHLRHAVEQELANADFSDVELIHNCLPETALQALDLTTTAAGLALARPLFINAITGGVAEAAAINRDLAQAARSCGLAVAVGSQMAAIENESCRDSYRVVREVYPEGIIFANIGVNAGVTAAQQAVEMVEADALQVHLNVPQELMMAEGDRDFRGYRQQLAAIVQAVKVPVIVKEVGFGIAREQAQQLQELGVAAIDVGGRGGTNFLQIECARTKQQISPELLQWGIPTALAILEARAGAPAVDILASGGINNGLLAAKALALGAQAVGIAGLALRILLTAGPEKLVEHLQQILHELKMVMVMTGCATISELRQAPLVITGRAREWMTARGLSR